MDLNTLEKLQMMTTPMMPTIMQDLETKRIDIRELLKKNSRDKGEDYTNFRYLCNKRCNYYPCEDLKDLGA